MAVDMKKLGPALTAPEEPAYRQVESVTAETPAHAEYLNFLLGKLCENDAYLLGQLGKAGVSPKPGSMAPTEEIGGDG